MSKTSVLIVDDHPMVRKGLRMIIDAQPDMHVVGEAGTLRDALDMAQRTAPQIVTLDLTMPGPSGVVSVERLRAAAPSARVIVVTMHDDPAYVRSAMAMGASGFVHKSAADSELVSAVRAVARGRVFIDVGDAATLETILSPKVPAPGASPIDTLSEREREVLRQVALGYTNQRIANEVGLSVKTVESYRARLMKKLGLRDRADLVRLAMDARII